MLAIVHEEIMGRCGRDRMVFEFTTTCATRGHRGRDRMVVGFTITYVISVLSPLKCM